jgi:hypothetical protein
MAFEQGRDRHARQCLRTGRREERRRLGQLEAHPQAEQHQHRAGQERQAPAPLTELRIGQSEPEQQEESVGGDEPDRRAERREHAPGHAPVRRRVLRGKQARPTPFATKPKPLTEAQYAQQQRRDPADLRVTRQEGDRHGRPAHQQ